MSDEHPHDGAQREPGVRADDGGARLLRSVADTRRAVTALYGDANIAEVHLNDEHLSAIIALQRQEHENEDRQSEREHGDRKESRRLSFALVIIAILAVLAIIVFLTIYREAGLLGYILSGIGGLIAGAFGGYGYAKR